MKIVAPVTNSSNFYSVVCVSNDSLPLNELAIVAYSLFGAAGNNIFIRTQSYEDLVMFCMEREKILPSPVILKRFPQARGVRIQYVPSASGDVYVSSPGALVYMSDFPWSSGDEISGEIMRVQDGRKVREEWNVTLVDMNEHTITHGHGEKMAAIELSNHLNYRWPRVIKRLGEMICLPPYITTSLELLKSGGFAGVWVFLGDILIINNFCLWSSNGLTWGVSTIPRQDTELDDIVDIGYGVRLLKEHAANRELCINIHPNKR